MEFLHKRQDDKQCNVVTYAVNYNQEKFNQELREVLDIAVKNGHNPVMWKINPLGLGLIPHDVKTHYGKIPIDPTTSTKSWLITYPEQTDKFDITFYVLVNNSIEEDMKQDIFH